MGDPLELTTWPSHESTFYEITSGAVAFSVRAARNIVIGLSKKVIRTCDYWIVLSNDPHSFIKKGNEHRVKVRTPGVLSPENYTKFWITWYGNFIRLGQGDDPNPLITCPNKVPGLRYITLDVKSRRERTPVHWKVELPPIIRSHKLKRLEAPKPFWYDPKLYMPYGAYIGGFEDEPVYIAKAYHNGSMVPGKYVRSDNVCYVPWGGAAHAKEEFQILCGYNLIWISSYSDHVPVNAVPSGYSEDDVPERLYIGRARHDGHIIPGKVQPSHRVCYIAYKDKEIAKTHYQILVIPNGSERRANKFYTYGLECDTGSESENDENEQDDSDYE
ncbi:PREDICTED: uncharacterized protein LOC106111941 [Papilio polytes]|uniref:uncharacterized protein LOC106111941 n=1 Tax=Papilio polytes TaxID=76194 RepID=UPI000675BC35|nr:PREDICTED: uncharacterized protein LOC106111941 [Papilio polytes]